MAEFDMNNLPNNSNKAKSKQLIQSTNNEKKLRQVTSKAKVKKKGLGQKVAETFIEEDVASVTDYVINDVAIPTIKELLADIFIGGIEMLFLGETGGRSRRSKSSGSLSSKEKTSYSQYYKSDNKTSTVRKSNGRYSVDQIIVETKDDAIEILEILDEAIDQYEQVTVADLYDTVGKTSNFIDNNWGWTNLRGSGYKRVREGYLLILPKVESL